MEKIYMETENIKKIYKLLNEIPVTKENEEIISDVKECLVNGDFITALDKIKKIQLESDTQEEYIENKNEDNT